METRASSPIVNDAQDQESPSDTTGNKALSGTRHIMLEQRTGLVDQNENLKEAEENGGRAPQADYGTRNDPRKKKDAGSAPANKAAASAPEQTAAPKRAPARKRK
jgi:hypothetical protein